MQKFLEKNYRWIVGAILIFMAVVSILNAWNDSAIFDETAHIPAGYSYLVKHEMRLNPEHPPLIKNLSALPLAFMDLNFDTEKPFWTGGLPKKWDEGQWAAGRHLLFEAGNDPDKIIFWSRIPIIILSLILGLFIFKWTRELTGIIGGLFALTLYAFDPNILGHNHFVTTDLGIAAFVTFAFYYFIKFLKHPSWRNVLIGGFFLGLVQLAKFSSILIMPVFGLALLIYPLTKVARPGEKTDWKFRFRNMGSYLGKGIVAFGFSLIIVWTVYAINTFNTTQDTMSQIIDFNFSPSDTANIKNVYTNRTLHFLNSNTLTRPLVEYGIGMGYVFRRVAGGNGAYFMGAVSGQAFLAYFPTVFVLKEPLVSLFFMLTALIISIWKTGRSINRSLRVSLKEKFELLARFIREDITKITLFLFAALYAYTSITSNLNIGFRHLFPILPFAFILTAKTISKALSKLQDKETKMTLGAAMIFLCVFLISGTLASYPHYMSYFNQIAGGPKNGYKYATDSNADWGQDLKRLNNFINSYNSCYYNACFFHKAREEKEVNKNKNNGYTSLSFPHCVYPQSLAFWKKESDSCYGYYQKIHDIVNDEKNIMPIEKIHVDYFGGADTKYYLGDHYQQWWDSKRPIEPGWYAISTNFSQGSIYDSTKKDEDSYRWLKKFNPVAQVGTSIFIYYVTEEEAIRISN